MNFPYYLVSVFIEYRNVVMLQKYLFDSFKKMRLDQANEYLFFHLFSNMKIWTSIISSVADRSLAFIAKKLFRRK